MADLQAYIGRGGFERGRIMPPSDLLLQRFAPNENVRISTVIEVPTGAALYVNGSTGDDARTKEQARSSSTPWLTIGRAAWGSTNPAAMNAAEAADAGDVVMIAAGTYTVAGTGENNIPAYNTANSGTSGNLITFRAVGTVVLQLSSGTGAQAGAYLRNYIRWDGKTSGPFQIDAANAPAKADTGLVVVQNATGIIIEGFDLDGDDYALDDNSSVFTITSSSVATPSVITTSAAHGLVTNDDIVIRNHTGSVPSLNQNGATLGLGTYRVTVINTTQFSIHYNGDLADVAVTTGGTGGTGFRIRQDNYSGIHCEDSSDITIRYNTFRHFQTTTNIRNGTGIMVYRCGGLEITRNTFEDSGAGIFLKGGFADQTAHDAVWSFGYRIFLNKFQRIGRQQHNTTPVGIAISLGNGSPGTAAAPVKVYQNLIIDAYQYGIELFWIDNTNRWNEPHYCQLVNNTLVAGAVAGAKLALGSASSLMANSSNLAWNNVMSGWDENVNWNGAAGSALESRWDFEHNVYHAAVNRHGSAEATQYATLAAWTTAYPNFDLATGNGGASTTNNPNFTNPGAGDYTLGAGSSALNLGVDVLDLDGDSSTTDVINAGAYITGTEVIGNS